MWTITVTEKMEMGRRCNIIKVIEITRTPFIRIYDSDSKPLRKLILHDFRPRFKKWQSHGSQP